MKSLVFIVAAFAIAGCATHRQAAQSPTVARGQAIAESHCSSCHATGVSGDSPAPEAPPFRRLSRNYRVDSLEEALAEGISVGHPAMPQFEFPPEDVTALVSYLQSIQESEAPPAP